MIKIIDFLINLFGKLRDKLIQEPDRPDAVDQIPGEIKEVSPARMPYKVPEIVYHDIKVPTRGKYKTKSGKCEGWIVHYTAGHNLQGAQNAVATIKSMASRRLYCPVMDINGVIHVSKHASIDGDYAYHAGKSKWMKKTGMSKYLGGMEICNAGKLTKHNNRWYPWWCFDSSGRFKGGHPIKNVRTVASKDNMDGGTYEAYTPKQEEALKNFMLWQLDVNPECKTWHIIGHDECAGYRGKTDPGGSLSKTMPDFREMLRKIMG